MALTINGIPWVGVTCSMMRTVLDTNVFGAKMICHGFSPSSTPATIYIGVHNIGHNKYALYVSKTAAMLRTLPECTCRMRTCEVQYCNIDDIIKIHKSGMTKSCEISIAKWKYTQRYKSP